MKSTKIVRACSVSWFNGFFKQIDVLQGSVDDAYSLRTLGNADTEEWKICKKAVKNEIPNRLLDDFYIDGEKDIHAYSRWFALPANRRVRLHHLYKNLSIEKKKI